MAQHYLGFNGGIGMLIELLELVTYNLWRSVSPLDSTKILKALFQTKPNNYRLLNVNLSSNLFPIEFRSFSPGSFKFFSGLKPKIRRELLALQAAVLSKAARR